MLGIDLDSEEQLLKDSVNRFVERDYPLDKRRELVRTEPGYSPQNWSTFAELGWLGLTFPEAAGGFDGNARQTSILMEAFGRALVCEPYLASVVMAGSAIDLSSSDARAQSLLREIGSGECVAALAYSEPDSRYDLNVVSTRAQPSDSGWCLSGYKSIVLNGDSANALIVSARTSGDEHDEEGISLFVVDTTLNGVDVRGYATNDGGRAAEVTLQDVEVSADALLGVEGGAYAVLEHTIDRAAAAVAAESLGIMTVLNELTLEYSKTRQQFGQPIGKNQALQHRLVDMFVALEESRSLLSVYMADVDSDDATERRRAVSAMKIQVGKAGRLVGQEAIQLHGGIAMTDEYSAGHYFKRMTVITRLFGDVDWHLDRFAALS